MTSSQKGSNEVIRRNTVRLVPQPAMVGCSDAGQSSISVVPLMSGDRVAGLEVRCVCGARAVIECVYPTAKEPNP
ncbi:MAG: hypothetical protein EXS02_11700 [Planctomycetes bacterium]|nr:hypothetical protein [Planctomycetota bacterium]